MIGMPTLLELDLFENLQTCKDLKLDFLEINLSFPYKFTEEVIKKINTFTEENNIQLTFHYPEYIDIGIFNDEIQKAYLDYFYKTIDLCNKLNVKLINMHLERGVVVTFPTHRNFIYNDFSDDYNTNIYNALKEMNDVCRENGIMFCIENTKITDFIINSFNVHKELGGYFTVDTGHNAMDKDYDYFDILEKNGLTLKHMHLHNYNGLDHQELDNGELDIKKLYTFAKELDLSIVIEVKTLESLKKSILYLRENLE